MSKLDITIYALFGEKNDSGYVLVDAKKTNEYINLAKSIESELEEFKLKHTKTTELLGLYRNFQYHVYSGNVSPRDRLNEKILKLEKELEELK